METFSSFTEDITIQMPRFSDQMREAVEGDRGSHALIVEVSAIHEGLTANFNHYSAEALANAVESWTQPFPKPIILNHNLEVDPLGRVMAAEMASEQDGSKYIKLQVAITDPAAIAKVIDKRYLTGSVGGTADESLCSVCGKDWSEASVFNMPCKHERGKTYKGKLAFLDRRGIGFREYSFVNNPADKRSIVKNMERASVADEWVDSVRIFDLSMDRPQILAFSEGETVDVLASLRKREAAPLYHQLKGSFLSALAVDLNEHINNEQESTVNEEHDDDLLDVVEQLSDDLSTSTASQTDDEANGDEDNSAGQNDDEKAEEGDEDEANAEEGSEDAEANAEADEEPAEEDGEAASDEADADDSQEGDSDQEPEEVEDGEDDAEEANAQGQERPRDKDRESGFNKPNAKLEKPSKRDADKTRDSDDTDSNLKEENAELTQKVASLELQVSEYETSNTTLLEENTRLKAALKRTLAERVVDQKIALGMMTAEERDEELEEHSKRTASSLADSLRDLSGMARQTTVEMPPAIKQKTLAVADESGRTVDSQDMTTEDKAPVAEEILVDVFMGRRAL